MTVADRMAQGYQPNWDIDRAAGEQAQLWWADIKEMAAASDEVKADSWTSHTGNLYIEVQCLRGGIYVPSGLDTTSAENWTHILELPTGQRMAITIPTVLLRDVVAQRRSRPLANQTRGSHPTRGVLVPLHWAIDYLLGRLVAEPR